VTPPFLLLAEREFRAYVATLSFWLALAVGPVAMAVVVALLAAVGRPNPPLPISIDAGSVAGWRSAAAALDEAAKLEDRRVRILPPGDESGGVHLTVLADGRGGVAIDGPLPFSATGRALLARTLERDAALARLGAAAPQPAAAPAAAAGPPTNRQAAGSAAARFGLVMALWLTLTGSLGMLLQAVVRERANRALESLLASASPTDIVAGKVLGVGAVSMLVLAAWLGAGALLAPFAPSANGLGAALVHELSGPAALIRAALIYLLAYGFYSLVTVAIAAGARDSAQAQNLSRPMFAVLLAAFFAALFASAGAGKTLGWLLFVPPFAPFMLLLTPSLSWGQEAFAIGLLAASTLVAGKLAAERLSLSPALVPGR
jgi:ABC-2 type transport system permease protein